MNTNKMFNALLICSTLLLSFKNYAYISSEQIEGYWLTEDDDSIVIIEKCEDKYCGKLVYFTPVPNEPKINETLCNLQIIGDLSFNSKKNQWEKGWIFDVDSEEAYPISVKQEGKHKLKLRAGSGLFSETFEWQRPKNEVKVCDKKET